MPFTPEFEARSRSDLQIAHDILHSALEGEIPAITCPKTKFAIHIAHDSIAWALGFPCEEAFAANLAKILNHADAAGCVPAAFDPDDPDTAEFYAFVAKLPKVKGNKQ